MPVQNPGVLNSFTMAYAGNALSIHTVSGAAAIPDDADRVLFIEIRSPFDAPDGLDNAMITGQGQAGRLHMVGGYAQQSTNGVSAQLFMPTLDSMRLAQYEESSRISFNYGEGLPGDPVSHISQMLCGIRAYLRLPATDPRLAVDNSIEDVYLQLHEGAISIWEERFAPLLHDQEGLWMLNEYLLWLDIVRIERAMSETQREAEIAVARMRGLNIAIEQTMGRLISFIGSRHPELDSASLRNLAEHVYTHFLRVGMADDLRAEDWQGPAAILIRHLVREALNGNHEPSVPAEATAALMERLNSMEIPELQSASPELRVEVVERMIRENREQDVPW